MIYTLSWTTKKHQKALSRPLHSKLKKIQGLFKTVWTLSQLASQPVSQSLANRAVSHFNSKSVCQSTSRSACQLTSQSVCQSAIHTVRQPVSQPASQPVSQSVWYSSRQLTSQPVSDAGCISHNLHCRLHVWSNPQSVLHLFIFHVKIMRTLNKDLTTVPTKWFQISDFAKLGMRF